MRRAVAILFLLGWAAAARAADPGVRWTYKMPFPIRSMTVSEQGVLLAGSDFGNYLHAVDVAQGKFLWKKDLKGSVWSAPVTISDVVFLVPNAAALICLKIETAEEVFWLGPEFPTVDRPPWQNKAPPAVTADRVFLVSLNGTLVKLDATGKLLEQLELQGPNQTDQFWSRPALVGNSLFVGSIRGKLHRIRSENMRRLDTLELGSDVRADIVGQDERVYVATVNGMLRVYRVDADATIPLWRQGFSTLPTQMAPAGRSPFFPVVREERLYIASRTSAYCLDSATGAILWKTVVPDGVATPIALMKDRAVCVSNRGNLVSLALDDGRILGRHALGAVPTAGPLAWEDFVLVGFSNGLLQAVGPP